MFLCPPWYNVVFLLIILFLSKEENADFHFNWYHSHISFQLVSFIYFFNWYHSHMSFQLVSFIYIFFIWYHLCIFFSFGILTIFQLVSIHSIFLSHFFSSLFNFVQGGEKCRILNDILYPHLSIYWGGEIWELSNSINIWLRGSIMNNCTHSLSNFYLSFKIDCQSQKGGDCWPFA